MLESMATTDNLNEELKQKLEIINNYTGNSCKNLKDFKNELNN